MGAQQPAPVRVRPQEAGSAAPCRRCAGRRPLPARARPPATPRCPACGAFAAYSGGNGCSPPRRDSTDPTRPYSRARPPWRQGSPRPSHPGPSAITASRASPVSRAPSSALPSSANARSDSRTFATHADRLRPRLEDRRLAVAGPAAGRPGDGRRRRGQRLPRPRVRRPRRPAGTRQLPARPAEGRCARRLEARPPRSEPHPPGQHRARPVGPAAWACGCSPARARRSTPRPRPAASCFGIFAALAEFERELIRERTVAGLEAARARGRKGGRKFALTKARHQAGDALPVRRPAGPVAGAGPEGPGLLNPTTATSGGLSVGFRPLPQTTRPQPRPVIPRSGADRVRGGADPVGIRTLRVTRCRSRPAIGRQVHRGPRVPVQRRREAPGASGRRRDQALRGTDSSLKYTAAPGILRRPLAGVGQPVPADGDVRRHDHVRGADRELAVNGAGIPEPAASVGSWKVRRSNIPLNNSIEPFLFGPEKRQLLRLLGETLRDLALPLLIECAV